MTKNSSFFTWGQTVNLIEMQRMRIETNIKLQVIDNYGNQLIPESEYNKPEVHFVQFEKIMLQTPINFTGLSIIAKAKLRSIRGQFQEGIHDWQITDFDHNLKGNPIVN